VSRKHAALQRRVARLAAEWQDPHDDQPWAKRDIVRNIDVAEDGEVTISIKPNRPHCPCCLLDLDNFRTKLLQTKGVSFATLNVVGVPAHDRWTRVLNR
jgi:metal-sulfur cluster biosynthetic enzyme